MANKTSKAVISALVMAKNEDNILDDCLKQLDFATEIIVLEQNSTDDTKKIAQKYTDKIISSKNTDFAKNRNLLSKEASADWLLYIDADERIDEKVKAEIKSAIDEGKNTCFYFPRKNIVLGKWLKHGGWWPDYVPRLIKKDSLISWYGQVHESPKIKGTVGYLKNPIEHITARNLDQMLEKTIEWAKIEAQLYDKANYPKVNILRVKKAMILEFTKRYFIKLGVLDGAVGLIEAIYQALHRAIILVYLWEIQNKSEEKFKSTSNE